MLSGKMLGMISSGLGPLYLSLLPSHHEVRSSLCHMSALFSRTAPLHIGTLHTCSYRPSLTEPLRTWANTIALSIHSPRGRQWTQTSACAMRTPGLREMPSLYECIHLTRTIYSNWKKKKGREKETVRWFPSNLGLHSILKLEESGFFWKRKFGQHRGGRQSPSPLQPKPPGWIGLSQPGHGPHMFPILKLERDGSAFRPHPGESALTGSEMSFTSS